MIAKIRHVATHTEHYDKECKFYQTIFGMKQITTGLVDENGKSNPDRGHISDGVIGMALLAKRAGSQAGIDHFGFEVDDVGEAVDRLNRLYPDLLHTRALTYVPVRRHSRARSDGNAIRFIAKGPGERPRRLSRGRLGTAALAQSHRSARAQAGGSRRILHQSLGAERRRGSRRGRLDHPHRRKSPSHYSSMSHRLLSQLEAGLRPHRFQRGERRKDQERLR